MLNGCDAGRRRPKRPQQCSRNVACSRLETILVSSATGDVLVCRDRKDSSSIISSHQSASPPSHATAGKDTPRTTTAFTSPFATAASTSFDACNDGYGHNDDGGDTSTFCYVCAQMTAELAESSCRQYGPCAADGASTPNQAMPCDCGDANDEYEDAGNKANGYSQNFTSSNGGGLLGGAEKSEEIGASASCDNDNNGVEHRCYEPSPYSWGIRQSSKPHSVHRPLYEGLLGGGRPDSQLGNGNRGTNDIRAMGNGHHHSSAPLTLQPSQDESEQGDIDDINLLPSFDYSHFGDDGNDTSNDGDDNNSDFADAPIGSPRMERLTEGEPLETQISWAKRAVSPTGIFASNGGTSMRQRSDTHGVIASCDTLDLSCGGMTSVTSCVDNDKKETAARALTPPQSFIAPDPPTFMHGVPTFFPAFSQIVVSKVSAHSQGSHVLMISREALLFSYGTNDHGQLGTGSLRRSFVQNPVIVTPLLENGGKAVDCAAGVDHSLVVVQTVGERVGHLLSQSKGVSEDRFCSPVHHHQVYGFGRNDFMKLGLNNPSSDPSASSLPLKREEKAKHLRKDLMELEDDVLLPRSVRLGVTFTNTSNEDEYPPRGVFGIAASIHHSAAIVRTESDLIELYTWGKGDKGALGLGSHVREVKGRSSKTRQIAKPTQRKKVSELPRVVAIPNKVESLSDRSIHGNEAYPTSVALGPECTSLVFSDGTAMSFGTSNVGMLGLGPDIGVTVVPREISFSESLGHPYSIQKISHGALHSTAVAKDGSIFSWGVSNNGRLGTSSDLVVWSPILIGVSNEHSVVTNVCAGFDHTIFITNSGGVLSCGRQSGRLGQGEVYRDVHIPAPMFGALQI